MPLMSQVGRLAANKTYDNYHCGKQELKHTTKCASSYRTLQQMEHQEEKATNHNAATRRNRQNFKTKLEHNEPLSFRE
jgi:hypothetical protein